MLPDGLTVSVSTLVMVIDGSADAAGRIDRMLLWDVNNGIARRSWARNSGAMSAIRREMQRTPGLQVTMPNLVNDEILSDVDRLFDNIG